MKRYEKYKDSGIEWIGEIPVHWEVKKIKYISKLQGGYAFKSDLFCEDGIPVIRIGDINNPINWDKCKKVPEELEISDDFILRQFDTLIALSGATTGKTAFINTKPEYAYINQRVAKVGFPNKLLYFNLSSDFVQKLIFLTADGSAQENISNSQIENLAIAIPPTSQEHTAIADYLDRKTAQIDELIAGKKRLLELYEEEKTAIINQAVTKGINPNVPMKDSGIEWIGEIPAHWRFGRIKYFIAYQKGKNPRVLKTTKTENSQIYLTMDYLRNNPKQILFVEEPEKYIQVNDGDILLLWDGSNAGEFVIAKNGVLSSTMAVLKLKNIKERFSWYYFKYFERKLQESTIGMGVPHVNSEELKNGIIVIPPPKEQTSIVEYIEKEIARINTKVEKTKKLIELLEEYKQALISEVVTGKIKVV